MTDAFDALRAPMPRIDPDPRFAAQLRTRLEQAVLAEPSESSSESGADMDANVHSLTPYLAVPDARRALDWYVEVLGAQRRGDPIVMPDGRIGHAELAFGDSVLMMADEHPEIGHVAPQGRGGALRVEVPDVDAAVERALERGGEVISAASDTGHGYSGTIGDPFGYRWMVSQAAAAADGRSGTRHGEAAYFTFQVPDDEAAKAFYGAVLGWQFTAGRVERGWNILGTGLPMAGLSGGHDSGSWILLYAVDDLDAALQRVRENGGRAGETSRQPYGVTADCVDNQGVRFWLLETPRP